jgi:hypothetical protein
MNEALVLAGSDEGCVLETTILHDRDMGSKC